MGFAGGGGTWKEAELEGSALDSEQVVLGPLPLSSFVAPPQTSLLSTLLLQGTHPPLRALADAAPSASHTFPHDAH